MTAFTVNSGGVTNWDTLSGGSVNATLDTYDISAGSTLLINTDSYQCANHSAAFGSVDTVSFSGIGGTLKLDGTSVRVIPYDTGTGNVPAIGTSITQGGVSATFLGVWSSWLVEPTASGSAMPASGFIKVKDKSGGSFAAGALSGIGASATGADVVGWIEVRGADTALITLARIGKFEVVGDWFELGTTNGSRGQVLACPTTATVAGVFAGVWIETGSGTGVFERFVGAGSMVALSSIPTDERGKIVWQTTSGIRIGSDGTNNVGFLPPSGCRVRIPNVILTCCTRTAGSGSGPRVLPNSSPTMRQEISATGGGEISVSHAVVQWCFNTLSLYSFSVSNSVFSDLLNVAVVATPIWLDNVIVGPTQAQLNPPFGLSNIAAGGTVQNCLFARFSTANAFVCQVIGSRDVAFINVKAQTLLNRTNVSAATWTLNKNTNCTWTNCVNIGARVTGTGQTNCTWTNTRYADSFSGTQAGTLGQPAFAFSQTCTGVMIDGIDFLGLTNVHPMDAIVTLVSCNNMTVRNIGSPSAPLDLGSVQAVGTVVSSTGMNDGIRVQRVYTSNTRNNLWQFLSSDNNVLVETMGGDYADVTASAARNSVFKGVRLTGSATGQTAIYGTHWKDSFTSATVGKIEVLCNEPTAESAAQCSSTGGTPRFDGAGSVLLSAVGDQVTWEMPYFALGHNALANLNPTLTGTNTGNLTYEFQYDKGSGYNGTWLTLNAANLSGAGAITPSVGVRLKVRATCATASASNLLTYIAIPTVTSATDQNQQYPLDTNTLTLTGLVSGSDVVVRTAGTTTVLWSVDSGGTTFTYTYSGAQTVDVFVHKAGYIPLSIRNLALTTSDRSIPIAQFVDRAYLE